MAISTHNQFENIEEDILSLFQQLETELPPQTAELNVTRLTKSAGIIVSLKPRNSLGASAWCPAQNRIGRIDFGFGEYSPAWELPIEGENPGADKDAILAEVAQMCRAVVAGNCEHQRRWLAITARIVIHGRTSSVTDAMVSAQFHPFAG